MQTTSGALGRRRLRELDAENRTGSNQEDANMTIRALTQMRRVAICFAAGVLGGLAVVLFSHVLFGLGSARRSE